MNLTAESWEQMLRSVKVEYAKGGDSELRSAPRVGFRAKLTIIPLSEETRGRPIPVWTRDISLNGFGFLHSEAMKVGTHFLVELPRQHNDGPPLRLQCAVRNCRQVPGGLYCIGASCNPLKARKKEQKNSVEPEPVPAKAPVPAAVPAATKEESTPEELAERIRKAMFS